MRRITWEAIGWIIIWMIVALFMFYTNQVSAQDAHISTTFRVNCLEGLGGDHYRLHIAYESDGVEKFTFAMGDVIGSSNETLPYTGHATTNIPFRFVTSIGENNDFYLDAHSEDSPYTFYLLFTNDMGIAKLPVNTWENVSECTPIQTPAPPVENAQIAFVAMNNSIPAAAVQVVSTGRVCVVKYLEHANVVLVCGGMS